MRTKDRSAVSCAAAAAVGSAYAVKGVAAKLGGDDITVTLTSMAIAFVIIRAVLSVLLSHIAVTDLAEKLERLPASKEIDGG